MNKNFIYAMLSAIALTGAVGLSSCSDKEVEDVNPNYDPTSNSVVVDVALNISTANTPTTRMSSGATQATSDDAFRGISDARLFSFIQTDNGKSLAAPATIGKRYDLSQLVTTTQISASNSRRVLEMSLPLKTNSLVFYGRATKDDTYKASTHGAFVTNELNNTTTNLSEITFTVAQRLDASKKTEFYKIEKLLSGILTCIMSVNLSQIGDDGIVATQTAGSNAYGFNVSKEEIEEIKWSDYAQGTNSPVTPTHERYALEDQLSQAYIQVTTIRGDNGELRAASGEALIQTIQDLWSSINKVRCAAPLCKEEAVAKRLAAAISERMASYFTPQSLPADGSAVTGVEFLDEFTSIRTAFLADLYWPVDETLPANAAYKRADYGLGDLASSTDLGDFPVNYGLPRGASHVKFDATNKVFYYPEQFNTSAVGGVPFTVEDYLYSPELAYFGNSSIRVSTNPHKVTDYPNGANANAPQAASGDTPAKVGGWNNESSWANDDWTSNYVTSASRSVAMKNNINYGTSLLKTTVKYATTSLRDNNHNVQKSFNSTITDDRVGGEETGEYVTEPDRTITVDGNSFELIGVIIGGQSRHVGWDYLPKKVGSGEPEFKYGFVTDDAIPSSAKAIPASGASSPNYTLVFDNYKEGTQAQQEAVYVALEFRNNSGQDFYGNYNLIRDGGTFYLIGQLNPNATTNLTAINWDSEEMTQYLKYHALPPYDTDGSTKKISRVFIQDFMTTANFVIGENSLKYAYLTVPDLRSSSLTLGLSVDIKWETGLNFNDIVLGSNDY